MAAVEPSEEGLNAVYRVDRVEAAPVVVKTATVSTDRELLTEAAVLSRLEAATDLPVPTVHATVEPETGPLDLAALVLEYRSGLTEPDLLSLSPAARERLVVEAGRHLAGIHGVRLADGFGPLDLRDGTLTVEPAHDWPDWFRALADDTVAGLRGEGLTTDDHPRFADLAPVVGTALDGPLGDRNPEPALLIGDYRPANLRLAPDSTPVVRAVLDPGHGPTADGLLDLALAENAFVDIPLGSTDRADRLRARLRTAYCSRRGTDPAVLEGERYARYRLYAWARRMAAFDYWSGLARGTDTDATAGRCRRAVERRLDRLR